jgi:hypothetical protein
MPDYPGNGQGEKLKVKKQVFFDILVVSLELESYIIQ